MPARPLVSFPAHALLILEERLQEPESEVTQLPSGMDPTEFALRVLVTVAAHQPHA